LIYITFVDSVLPRITFTPRVLTVCCTVPGFAVICRFTVVATLVGYTTRSHLFYGYVDFTVPVTLRIHTFARFGWLPFTHVTVTLHGSFTTFTLRFAHVRSGCYRYRSHVYCVHTRGWFCSLPLHVTFTTVCVTAHLRLHLYYDFYVTLRLRSHTRLGCSTHRWLFDFVTTLRFVPGLRYTVTTLHFAFALRYGCSGLILPARYAHTAFDFTVRLVACVYIPLRWLLVVYRCRVTTLHGCLHGYVLPRFTGSFHVWFTLRLPFRLLRYTVGSLRSHRGYLLIYHTLLC